MGYTTIFSGNFILDKPIDKETFSLLKGLSETRRMKRDSKVLEELGFGPSDSFGVEGEFFIGGKGFAGQDDDPSVLDHNTPPKTQPGLWCQWRIQEDHKTIIWDGGEKFYEAEKWIIYFINKILKPRGYTVNGAVNAQGEEESDQWHILVLDNEVFVEEGWLKGVEFPDLDAYYQGFFDELKKLGIDVPEIPKF